MLSVNLIERLFHGRRHEQLLDNLVSNGMDLPLPLHIRLGQVPAAAVALGLRRLAELTYGPTPLSREMTTFLLGNQEADGSFGHDPLATACAVAALGKLLAERSHQGATIDAAAPRERALAALASMQNEDGLFSGPADRTEQDRAMNGALILLLLGRDEEFRRTVRSAELFDWFEQRQDDLEPDTQRLWALARLGTPTQFHPTPTMGSIAA